MFNWVFIYWLGQRGRKTTRAPDAGCKEDGTFPGLDDESKFYECVNGRRYDFICGDGTVFDESFGTCNYPENSFKM